MNMEEFLHLHLMTEEQKSKVILWTHNLKNHCIYFPKKIFWRFHKNIPILNQNGEPLVFERWNEAYEVFKQINTKNKQ
jgi:hypothetical protein